MLLPVAALKNSKNFWFLDFNIFLFHSPVDSAEDPEAEPDASVSEDAILSV